MNMYFASRIVNFEGIGGHFEVRCQYCGLEYILGIFTDNVEILTLEAVRGHFRGQTLILEVALYSRDNLGQLLKFWIMRSLEVTRGHWRSYLSIEVNIRGYSCGLTIAGVRAPVLGMGTCSVVWAPAVLPEGVN